ncbi:hypothetical protein ACZ91_46275, partial [Streptomyces regensis]
PQSDRLRDSLQNNVNYAGTSRITRVQDSGSRPPGTYYFYLNKLHDGEPVEGNATIGYPN